MIGKLGIWNWEWDWNCYEQWTMYCCKLWTFEFWTDSISQYSILALNPNAKCLECQNDSDWQSVCLSLVNMGWSLWSLSVFSFEFWYAGQTSRKQTHQCYRWDHLSTRTCNFLWSTQPPASWRNILKECQACGVWRKVLSKRFWPLRFQGLRRQEVTSTSS